MSSPPYELPPSFPRTHNRVLRAFGRTVMRLIGWRFDGTLPDVPRAVAIVVPHTSNWDFPLGLAAKWALELEVSWLGKHTLFKTPLGGFFRRIGGIPVDRSSSNNLVDQMAQAFREREKLVLVIAPEGTRKKVAQWKTGFYHIARGAGVPIVLIAFDWGRKVIRFGPTLEPTGDVERDVAWMRQQFADVRGKRPEHA